MFDHTSDVVFERNWDGHFERLLERLLERGFFERGIERSYEWRSPAIDVSFWGLQSVQLCEFRVRVDVWRWDWGRPSSSYDSTWGVYVCDSECERSTWSCFEPRRCSERSRVWTDLPRCVPRIGSGSFFRGSWNREFERGFFRGFFRGSWNREFERFRRCIRRSVCSSVECSRVELLWEFFWGLYPGKGLHFWTFAPVSWSDFRGVPVQSWSSSEPA